MAQNITLLGASYTAVPAVVLPVTGGGSARFDDTSDADATAADIAGGKTAYVNGQKVTGTATVAGVTWETLADQNVTVVADSPNYFVITNYTTPFAAGETYRITWGQGGTQYICQTIQDETGGSYDGYVIGNPGVVGHTPDTGEPFLIYRDRSNRLACATNQAAGTLHVTIERQTSAGIHHYYTGSGAPASSLGEDGDIYLQTGS